MELVNEQEIALDNINSIEIAYHSEDVTLVKSNTDSLLIKEYMNKDNAVFYADITNSDGKLTIKQGNRLFLRIHARVEVYIPELNMKDLTIKTTSGRIKALDEYICSKINMESTSGSISVNTIIADTINLNTTSGIIYGERIKGNTTVQTTSGGIKLGEVEGTVFLKSSSGRMSGGTINGNINVRTTSGKIIFGDIVGDAFAESLSGRIELNRVSGTITAETTSGSIHCSTTENGGNISLASTSGGIYLGIPANNSFNFSSRTTSGHLSTPFSDRLFIPVSDKNSAQGIIGEKNGPNITIKTTSGSIKVDWIN
jgi:DUF4097 and DUF4098 domain-containing protein YvlB